MSAKERILPETELKDVLKTQKGRETLERKGFKCMKCGGFASEKLIHAARCHGVDVDELIREILDGAPGHE